MTRIALLDYGMGNLHSAAKALEHVGATVDVTNDPKLIAQADKIVFPGVGAMRDCMQGMREAGIDEVIRNAAFNKPVLAICVGMQALMQHSEENGGADALGIFEGVVKRFPDVDRFKSSTHGLEPSIIKLIQAIQCGKTLNKMHVSTLYIASMLNRKIQLLLLLTCDYGLQFCTAIHKENLFATQFHPEKSHTAGLQLLKNFVEWDI